ncbi:MAG: VWA domain-containing protein [Dehalococcoidia bacterium]
MRFRYSGWDGSQQIDPLQPDELLDLLANDLLDDGDLRRAMERLLQRGGMRPDGDRLQGIRDLMEQLRNRRQEQLDRYRLDTFMQDIEQRLDDIVNRERAGIDRRLDDAADDPEGTPELQDLLRQMAQRKLDALDALPRGAAGMVEKLMDYEFMDEQARDDFKELVNDLRQKMLGDYFQNMKQTLEGLTPADLAPMREMVRELNKLLAKHLNGDDSEADFREFMDRFGSMFPPEIDNIDDLIDYLEKQAAQAASLLKSMPEDMRRQMEETIRALLRDDRLQWDLAQMGGLIEQITGRPLGRAYPFGGDTSVGFDQAMELMRGLNDLDELESQLRQALRYMDLEMVDEELLQEALGPESKAVLEELRRIAEMLEESGYARRNGNELELTPRAVRRLGERALRDIFAELRKDRAGQHDVRSAGQSSEQEHDTKPWEFGDPFLVDIGKTVSNAVRRQGSGIPIKIEVDDIEVHKTESLVTASTVIVLDMSYSMVRTGAFREAKRVALALNTLIKGQYPRDYLSLVVFSFFAMELDAERLLQNDWVRFGGTNIQVALKRARQLLSKQRSTNRQIILITDARPTTYSDFDADEDESWALGWPRFRPGAVEETLKEVRRCTRSGITINTFMMAQEPSLVAFARLMSQINKGRAFFATPGHLGQYILVDYLKGKSKIL